MRKKNVIVTDEGKIKEITSMIPPGLLLGSGTRNQIFLLYRVIVFFLVFGRKLVKLPFTKIM